jgi:hemolysin III
MPPKRGNCISADELANAVTHGAGFVLSVTRIVTLAVLAGVHGSAWRIVSCAIYDARGFQRH